LSQLEYGFANLCVHQGEPPLQNAPLEAWLAWFRWCAAHVEAVPAEVAQKLVTDGLKTRIQTLEEAVQDRDRAMPEVLTASVVAWEFDGQSVALNAYSGFDVRELPRWIFVLFSKMDGERPWRDALRLAEQEAGVQIGEEMIHLLYRHGSLSGVDGLRFAPGASMVVRMVNGEPVKPAVVRI